MKRIIVLLLALSMLLALCACGKKQEEALKFGVLEASLGSNQFYDQHMHHENNGAGKVAIEYITYSNLNAALLDFGSGKLDVLPLENSVAAYVLARNSNLQAIPVGENFTTTFSMMTMETNREVYDILNNAIVEMKADGTLEQLIENDLKAYIEKDPTPADLPRFEGGKTIRVGVTGDMPPMDFVAANGKAAGFNIALLTEIANRAQVNIELVQIETGARAIALSSGDVDAVFWTKGSICETCGATWSEGIVGTITTESYFSEFFMFVQPKPAE